jgi:hypothetical protein
MCEQQHKDFTQLLHNAFLRADLLRRCAGALSRMRVAGGLWIFATRSTAMVLQGLDKTP